MHNRARRGQTLGFICIGAFTVSIIGVGLAVSGLLVGGHRETQNAIDSGALSMAKKAPRVKVSLGELSERARLRFGPVLWPEASGDPTYQGDDKAVGLLEWNRLYGYAYLALKLAEEGNDQTEAKRIVEDLDEVGRKLTLKLDTSRELQDECVAFNRSNSVRMLKANLSDERDLKALDYKTAYLDVAGQSGSDGGLTQLQIPRDKVNDFARVVSLGDTGTAPSGNRYLKGYHTGNLKLAKIQGIVVHPEMQPRVVSNRVFDAAPKFSSAAPKNVPAPGLSVTVPPNSFHARTEVSNAARTGYTASTRASSVVGVMPEFVDPNLPAPPPAIPNGYLHFVNPRGVNQTPFGQNVNVEFHNLFNQSWASWDCFSALTQNGNNLNGFGLKDWVLILGQKHGLAAPSQVIGIVANGEGPTGTFPGANRELVDKWIAANNNSDPADDPPPFFPKAKTLMFAPGKGPRDAHGYLSHDGTSLGAILCADTNWNSPGASGGFTFLIPMRTLAGKVNKPHPGFAYARRVYEILTANFGNFQRSFSQTRALAAGEYAKAHVLSEYGRLTATPDSYAQAITNPIDIDLSQTDISTKDSEGGNRARYTGMLLYDALRVGKKPGYVYGGQGNKDNRLETADDDGATVIELLRESHAEALIGEEDGYIRYKQLPSFAADDSTLEDEDRNKVNDKNKELDGKLGLAYRLWLTKPGALTISRCRSFLLGQPVAGDDQMPRLRLGEEIFAYCEPDANPRKAKLVWRRKLPANFQNGLALGAAGAMRRQINEVDKIILNPPGNPDASTFSPNMVGSANPLAQIGAVIDLVNVKGWPDNPEPRTLAGGAQSNALNPGLVTDWKLFDRCFACQQPQPPDGRALGAPFIGAALNAIQSSLGNFGLNNRLKVNLVRKAHAVLAFGHNGNLADVEFREFFARRENQGFINVTKGFGDGLQYKWPL